MNSRANWSNFANFDSAGTVAAANRHGPQMVSLLLVVLIGWQIASILWSMVPGSAAGANIKVPASVVRSSSRPNTAAEVNTIAKSHLFGIADAEGEQPAQAAEPDEDLLDTRLVNLTLKGTVASDEPEFSVALISDGSNEQKVYVVGDAIGSGTTLHAIYSDRVVLNERGAFTNLKLPKEFSSVPVTAATPNRSLALRNRTDSKSVQAMVSQNLTKLTDVIRPTPYLKNGQPAGYRVYPGRDRKQFAALGLRPGDLIKDIDGQALNDPTQAMQIFQSLGTSQQVTVTVERNGKPETLVLKTSQLDLGGEQKQ